MSPARATADARGVAEVGDRDVVSGTGLVVREPGGQPAIETLGFDEPGPGEVRVKILASGICHTDAMVARGVWWSDFPYVLGHEGVGTVEAIGLGCSPGLLGRRVVLAWRSGCGRCRFCIRGDSRLCADLPQARRRVHTLDGRTVAPSLRLGTHASHVVVSETQAIPVPDDLPPESLAIIGCAVMTGVGAVFNSAKVRPGESVAVFGCGGVGLNVIQGARLAHARRIIAVDTNPAKLATATRFGATHVVEALADVDIPAFVREHAGGVGVDHAFDTVGVSSVVETAVAACDLGGSVTLLGTPTPDEKFGATLATIFFSRLTVRASTYGDVIPSRDIPWLVDVYARGELLLDELVSSIISLDAASAAISGVGQGGSLRQVIRIA